MEIIRTREELQKIRRSWHDEGARIGLVPTMGYLHDGHIKLKDALPDDTSRVLFTIYINPTQFAANEDLDKYPVDLENDFAKLAESGVDAVFLPDSNLMYPQGVDQQVIFVEPGTMGSLLCGIDRPTHFRGVLTVVSKLFNLIRPHSAVFGEKDFQQLRLIEKMVEDLSFAVTVCRGTIWRHEDGLAMSSRNRYLSETERAIAPLLQATLLDAANRVRKGRDIAETLSSCTRALEAAWGKGTADYVEIRREDTLAPVNRIEDALSTPSRLFGAGRLGAARLIDNLALSPS